MKSVLFNSLVGGGGLVLGKLFGELDGLLTALIIFVVLDYISGIYVGILDKNLSSKVGFKGILKKTMIFMIVIVGHVIDTQLIGSGNAFRSCVLFILIANEGLSILENCGKCGLPIPDKVLQLLLQLRGKKEDIKDAD